MIRQIGGWGLVLGDEGSGARLGRSLLAAALGAVDGFRPITPFLRAIIDEHGGSEGIISFSLAARPVEFAAYAPRILTVKDSAAQELLAASAADVAASIDVLQGTPPLPVTLIGGLGPAYADQLARRWTVVPAQGSALDGALMLVREAA